MTIGEQVRSLAHTALDLLFPPRCVSCRRVGTHLCQSCIDAFPAVPAPICPICGEPVPIPSTCKRCLTENRVFASVNSAFLFEGSIRPAIHALKYLRRKQLAEPLASGMAVMLRDCVDPDATLCAVPLHQDRLKSRGYNQSELLADHLSLLWGLPLLPNGTLIRTRNTAAQVGLAYQDRQKNVGNAFAAPRGAVAGRAILLIDDVCTTGATLSACASALMEAGALNVRAVTLARAG